MNYIKYTIYIVKPYNGFVKGILKYICEAKNGFNERNHHSTTCVRHPLVHLLYKASLNNSLLDDLLRLIHFTYIFALYMLLNDLLYTFDLRIRYSHSINRFVI